MHTYSRRSSAVLAAVICALGLLALTAAPSPATYTGLVVIPTAEIVDENHYCVELQLDGEISGGHSEAHILNTQFGINPRLEAGLDIDLSRDADSRLLVNAKYMLVSGHERLPDLAAGVHTLSHDVRSVPYIVATKSFGRIRGHLGGQRCEGKQHFFVGSDYALTDKWTVMADYTSGDDNFSSVGLDYQFSDKFALTAGVQYPNAREENTLYTIHFVFCGPYCR